MDIKSKKEKDFSFTKDVDGVRKTVRGNNVENGWVITIEKSWTDKDSVSGEEELKYDEQTYITKTNPLDGIKESKEDSSTSKKSDIGNMLSDITNSQGMMLVD